MSLRQQLLRKTWNLGMNGLMHGASRVAIGLRKELRFAERGVRIHRDVHYAPRASCRLDVYVPPGGGRRPVALYVHGGGFKLGSKRSHEPVAKPFLEEGYVVFLIDYRLTPQHPYPAGLEDVADAFLFVAEHAARYGGDPSRIVVAGESAGGNLSLALTLMTARRYRHEFARRVFDSGHAPRVAMPLCGYLQTSNPGRYVGERLHPFIKDRIHAVSGDYLDGADGAHGLDLADPLLELERDGTFDRPLPPMFVSCGSADPILQDSLRLARALEARGVDHVLRVEADQPHGYQVMVIAKPAELHWRHALDFAEDRLPDPG